jgi:hypothetical protein
MTERGKEIASAAFQVGLAMTALNYGAVDEYDPAVWKEHMAAL